MHRKIIVIILALLLLASSAGSLYWFVLRNQSTPPSAQPAPSIDNSQQSSETPTPPETKQPEPVEQPFSKTQHSTTDPASIWVIVNKKHPLPANYAPDDLTAVAGGLMRAEAAKALGTLLQASRDQNVPLQIISSYRSYSTQTTTYNNYVATDGQSKADTYSARPGHSEHQTGLAVDLGSGTCNLEICFATTPAGKWLAQNAAQYGFIIRYGETKTAITGYQYEPWHIRYVGVELAKDITPSGKTLEEYFDYEPAPNY